MAPKQTTKKEKKARQTVTAKAAKPVKKAEVKQPSEKAAGDGALTVSVLGTDGKPTGKLTLPAEFFGVKPNKTLMAQAVRVYLANQRQGSANTKTRGEVEGSTRKIYKQKGTGRARHGSIRAHIFVGGGIVFGPVTHDFTMEFPAKMRRKALASALSHQLSEGHVIVADGLSEIDKTKSMARALTLLGVRGSTLLVLSGQPGNASRAARNIADVDVVPALALTTYTVLTHQNVIFMKEAVSAMKSDRAK